MKLVYCLIIIVFLVPFDAFSRGSRGTADDGMATENLTDEEGVSMVDSESESESESEGNISKLLPETLEEDDSKNEEMLWKLGSIMYNKEHMDWLDKAKTAHDKRIPLSKVLPNLFTASESVAAANKKPKDIDTSNVEAIIEVPDVITPKEAPAFYLSSILYLAPDNWSIWINGEKVSYGEQHYQVEVMKVTENNVTLVWRESMIDMISPGWKDKYRPMSDERFMSNDKNIVVDMENGDISFVLGVNQSFDSMFMEIVEGVAYTKDVVLSSNDTVGQQDGLNIENIDGMIDGASDIIDNVLPEKVENNSNNNDNLSRKKVDPDLKFANDYVQQLESLRSILGK